MRKLFTSVVAALCLAAPMSTLSAQNTQQLTEAQKEAIKKEVLPVVFEQIKEQAGIDILGWANPSLSNTFAGIPVLESSNLRAASAESVSVKPDSIILNTANMVDAVKGLIDLSEYQQLITMMIGDEIKVTFEDYDTKTLPISLGNAPITVDLPAVINISGKTPIASVYFDSTVGGEHLFDLDVDWALTLLGTARTDLIACSLGLSQTLDLEANVDIQDGLTDFGVNDTDYLVTVGLAGLLSGTSNQVPASLYAIAADVTGVRTPMGTAVVTLNPTNTFPIQRIDVTPYTNGQAGAQFYFDLNMSVSNQVYELTVDKYTSTAEDAEPSETTTITTSGTIAPTIFGGIQDLVNSVITRAVNELANEGEATWFQMVIDKNDATIATITVEPSVVGTDAIAEIFIDLQDKGAYTVTATADLAGSNKIAVDVVKAPETEDGEETVYGTAYFTSNIAGVITANESVEESVATMKVVPTQNAIRVTNVDKGTYRIVSMTGAVVASGHINGDTYIPTASLAQGIYIVAVEANGTLQSVKVKL